jgi:hypothetical protein
MRLWCSEPPEDGEDFRDAFCREVTTNDAFDIGRSHLRYRLIYHCTSGCPPN